MSTWRQRGSITIRGDSLFSPPRFIDILRRGNSGGIASKGRSRGTVTVTEKPDCSRPDCTADDT